MNIMIKALIMFLPEEDKKKEEKDNGQSYMV